MTYDPNDGERFVFRGYDGRLHVSEWLADQKQWLIYLRNRLRLAELEQRQRDSVLNEPELTTKPEVR